MAEQQVKFKKPSVNFEAILQKQRAMEDDEKFAISDSLQTFIDESSKQAGYQNQEKLDKAGIRQEVINFVENYTISNLDGLKGADYDEALQTQKSTEKQIEEIEKTGQLNDAELEYIKATVGQTNQKLGEILGISTRLKLAFRDFKKELKPLKLAARLGINRIPIIGKRIDRAIRAEEEGEAEALRIKRGLRKRTARETRKAGDLDFAETQPESEIQQTKTTAKQVTGQLLGIDQKGPELFGGDKEQRVEEERESDTQFETTSNILEQILDESKLTNELLGAQKKKGKGLLGDLGAAEGILATLGIQKFAKMIKGLRLASIGSSLLAFGAVLKGLALLLAPFAVVGGLAFLNRPQGEIEKEEMAQQGQDTSGSFMNEGVLQEDIDDENRRRLEAINKDEFKKLKNRGDLDDTITLEQYSQAKKEAGVGQRITSYFTGDIKDAKVEKVLAALAGPITTVEGNVTTNTDTSSILNTNQFAAKMDNVATMNESGMTKELKMVDSIAPSNNIVNNVQNNDNSQNTNKTEYGSSTIGTKDENLNWYNDIG